MSMRKSAKNKGVLPQPSSGSLQYTVPPIHGSWDATYAPPFGTYDSPAPGTYTDRAAEKSIQATRRVLQERSLGLRGVPTEELEARLSRAQALMLDAELDFMLITTQEDYFYFTGLLSRFWHSPTRPYYLVVPATGDRPIAIVPTIMTDVLVSRTWLAAKDVRDWPAPRPEDDGVTLVLETLASLPRRFGRGGFMLGHESVMRVPVNDIDRLRQGLEDGHYSVATKVVDGSRVMRELRLIKSAFEVDRIDHICSIASAAFEALPCRVDALCKKKAAAGEGAVTEREVRECFRTLAFEFGADETPYVAFAAGNSGVDNIILEPSDAPLMPGDVVFIDTGLCFEGYWCDFCRNWIVGGEEYLSETTKEVYERVWKATEAGMAVARRHGTSSEVYRAMGEVMGVSGGSVGRYGHGIGLHITEHFSNNATDEEPLRRGITMTLEPGMNVADNKDCMIVHEEVIVITERGAEWLSSRASPTMLPIMTGRQAFAGLHLGLKSRL